MKNLQEIKNTYAQEQGYDDWEQLERRTWSDEQMGIYWQEICIRAQKVALEKAAEKGCDSLELFNSEYEILSKAITNPENLVR